MTNDSVENWRIRTDEKWHGTAERTHRTATQVRRFYAHKNL